MRYIAGLLLWMGRAWAGLCTFCGAYELKEGSGGPWCARCGRRQ